MTEQDLYQFDGYLESAAQAVFTDALIPCAIPADETKFQSVRPRAELVFTLGAGAGQHHRSNFREQAWRGSFRVIVISNEDALALREILTKTRLVMSTLPDAITDNHPMPYHSIYRPIRWMGESPIYKPEDGIFYVTMNYDFDFSIKDVWDQLVTTP